MTRIFNLPILISLLVWGKCFSQEEILMPVPSSSAVVTQTVGFTDVTIKYSRPGLKGRELKKLVPDGEVWRTGANRATTIIFSDDIFIEGHAVPKGTYSLWSIPGANEWTIILNKKVVWGTQYNTIEQEDFLRFRVKPGRLSERVETFEFTFSNVTDSTCIAGFNWEQTRVEFKIKDDVLFKLKALIVKRLDSLDKIVPASFKDSAYAGTQYYRAATYNHAYTNELTTAHQWIDKASTLFGSMNNYQYYYLKAQLFQKEKKFKQAIEYAEKSLELSKTNQRAQGLGFVEKNEELLKELKKRP